MSTKTLKISDGQILRYLQKTGKNQSSLGRILNVRASTITRWVSKDTKYPQSPTSTALLVLLPLMISEGIDILPEPDESKLSLFIKERKWTGLITDSDLKNPKKLKAIRRIVARESSPHFLAARKLYEEMKTAWEKIDQGIVA
jgi:hypothetical protein